MSLSLHFLGVGSAQAVDLGSSGAVLERDGAPLLLIDCGPETLSRYVEVYNSPPHAVYITHTHMDHVAGLERLFYRVYFDAALKGGVRLYAHAALVPHLQGRIADYPNVIAEGNANFWDAFRLIPCSRGFWHEGFWFDVFPTRHHAPMTSFGLALRGAFAWTGDTRPVPEMLAHYAANIRNANCYLGFLEDHGAPAGYPADGAATFFEAGHSVVDRDPAGNWHRRQHRDLQRGLWRSASAAAV